MAYDLEKDILKLMKLLQLNGLTIPAYQRPYKWTARNTNQLFQDIHKYYKDQSAYRLGTLVFHRDKMNPRF